MAENAAQLPVKKKSLLVKFADRYGVDAINMMTTLKATAFRQKNNAPITDEQMMALIVVADQYRLNPFTKEIYAFPDKGGIVPIVGVDGWSRLMNENPEFNGMRFEFSAEKTQIDEHHRPCPESCTCIIYRKDREYPVEVTEYLDEVYRAPFMTRDKIPKAILGPWQTHTKRFLRHKTMIQCARLAFGYVGIYDEDEGERIIEASFTEVPVADVETVTEVKADDKLKDKLRKKAEASEPVPFDAAPEDVQSEVD